MTWCNTTAIYFPYRMFNQNLDCYTVPRGQRED